MERFFELLQIFLKQQWLLIVLVFLLIITVSLLIYKNKTAKKIKNTLEMLSVDFNTIKSMPLSFKLNKVKSATKSNPEFATEIDDYINSYDVISKAIYRLDDYFAAADDGIANDNFKLAQGKIDEINDLIDITYENVKSLDIKLDELLEQELNLRSQSTKLKEQYQGVKKAINDNTTVSFSEDVIKLKFENIENEFKAFDEWMFVSEFENSHKSIDKIKKDIEELENFNKELPELLPIAKEVIPSKISNISSLYSEVRNENIYVDHLDVTQLLSVVTKDLSSDLANLRTGLIDEAKEGLDKSNKELDELIEKLAIEKAAKENISNLDKSINLKIKEILDNLNKAKTSYSTLNEFYNFVELDEKIINIEKKYADSFETYKTIKALFKQEVPASQIIEKLSEFEDNLDTINSDSENVKEEVFSIVNSVNRAKKQLLKLQLIINEVLVKITQYQIPTISNDYLADVEVALKHTLNIETLLNEKELNINLLNGSLDDGIDYIYRLYNNVNNIVGMVVMIENSIVFANRYRTDSPQVDSDLSKVEMYFHNGEYTQALTDVLEIIKKIHPRNYKELIKENAVNEI